MARTTWTFGTAGSGLQFIVTIDGGGTAQVQMIEGSMALHALWLSDGDSLRQGEASLSNSLSVLERSGGGAVDANGNTIGSEAMTVLSPVELGSAGTTTTTYLTAGETQSFSLDAGSLGIRATSVNGSDGLKLNARADPFVDRTAPVISPSSSSSYGYKETVDANAVVAAITTATDNVGVTQYRFVSADGQTVIGSTTEDGHFSIDSSGKVSLTYDGWYSYVAQFASGEGDQHIHYVQAGDAKGNWSNVQQITLTELDDKAPQFATGEDDVSSFLYNENNVANDVVAEIPSTWVTDNSGVVSHYRFVSTDGQTINGATTSDGAFSIDNAGKISITAAGAAAVVNDILTGQTVHHYLLQAGDAQGNWSSSRPIRLNAWDSTAPVFRQDVDYSFSYRENQSVNAVVAAISTATDKVGVIQFRFVSPDGLTIHGATTEDGSFSIDRSGKISITATGVGSAENDFEFGQTDHTYYVQAGDAQGNWSRVQQITLNEHDLSHPLDGVDFGTEDTPIKTWPLDSGWLDPDGFTSDDRIGLDLANLADAYGQKAGSQAMLGVSLTDDSNNRLQRRAWDVGSMPTRIAHGVESSIGPVFMQADWAHGIGSGSTGAINTTSGYAPAYPGPFGYSTGDVSRVISQDQILVSWPQLT